ncbi:apolipoprotein N-acyltransferase [Halopseudomonas sp.]|uniref:apolipoprotein N-acyltransferase n=1 Tax=Halopseudomonas sp. TaxID=2901191 RepID=UPI003002BF70
MSRQFISSSAVDDAVPRSDQRAITLPLPARVALALLSGALVGIPWLSPELFWTAWIGWIPLLFALRHASLKGALMCGWLTGTVCFAIASHWMLDFVRYLDDFSPLAIVGLSAGFWLYAGLAIGLACVLFRWLTRQLGGWELLSFPLCLVAAMAWYPLLFQTHFAEAQAAFLLGLQGVDLVGAKGLDVVMMLCSVLLYRILAGDGRGMALRGNVLATGVLAVWFAYGAFSLASWDERMQGWDSRSIGLVQPNDPVTLALPEPPRGFSREHPEEMAATVRLAAAGAQLVVWPEARYKGYFDYFSVRQAYAQALADSGVALIFHDPEGRWVDGNEVHYNSVVHLDPTGEQAGLYRKMRRMPFGEYRPAFFSLPGLNWLTTQLFGEFLRPLAAGTEHVEFAVDGMRIIPKVCYETAFPTDVADAIGGDAAGKVLLFLSQDNWFGETTQPFQHRAMSVVRAVENRVPMIHLINNGPSVVAAPNGRTLASTPAFSRAELVAELRFSPDVGGSLYSRYPRVFSNAIHGVLGLLCLLALVGRGRRREG